MLYIPISFKVDGRPDSSAFQSVIAAEGIAPYSAKTFAGMGGGAVWCTASYRSTSP